MSRNYDEEWSICDFIGHEYYMSSDISPVTERMEPVKLCHRCDFRLFNPDGYDGKIWVKKRHFGNEHTMSVCYDANLYRKLGLNDDW